MLDDQGQRRTRSPRPRASARSRRTSRTQLFTAEIPKDVRSADDRRLRLAQDKVDAYCDALTTAAEPLAEKSLDAYGVCLVEVDGARLVQRLVEAVRARARPDQAGRLPDGVRAARRARTRWRRSSPSSRPRSSTNRARKGEHHAYPHHALYSRPRRCSLALRWRARRTRRSARAGDVAASAAAADATTSPSPAKAAAEARSLEGREEGLPGRARVLPQNDKGGWNESACRGAADKFASVAREHSNLVEAQFMVGPRRTSAATSIEDAEQAYQAATHMKGDPTKIAMALSNLGEIYYKRRQDRRREAVLGQRDQGER